MITIYPETYTALLPPLDTLVDNPVIRTLHCLITIDNFGCETLLTIAHVNEFRFFVTLLPLLRFVRTAAIHENMC